MASDQSIDHNERGRSDTRHARLLKKHRPRPTNQERGRGFKSVRSPRRALLPLNGCRRLRRHIQNHTVDLGNRVRDARGDAPEHPGFLHSFTPPLERDTGDLRQSLSYPSNWWRGANGVNWENTAGCLGTGFEQTPETLGNIKSKNSRPR